MIPLIEHLIAAGVRKDLAAAWLPSIEKACTTYGIDTSKRVAAFLAQCAHETGGFTALQENLNYSADGMAAIWPGRFAVLGADRKAIKVKGKNQPNKFALALHRKPEAIANVVYSNRMGNGSIESGDGWKHRGMGLKQLTGMDNHRRCGIALGGRLCNAPRAAPDP